MRFLNLCRNNNLKVWHIKNKDDSILMSCSLEDFYKMKPIKRKCRVKIKVLEKHGLPFKLFKEKKHKFFLIGIICFLLIAKILSMFIWNISIDGNYSYTNEELCRYLNNIGIKNGLLKSKISCDEIEYNIRNNYNDITWVSAEIKGTKLIIHIKENFDGYIAKEETKPYDIISNVNGTISKIITRSGKPLVKVGDSITENQPLISGILEIIGDDTTVINRRLVSSDADIYANVILDYKDQFSMEYLYKDYTGDDFNIFKISILGKSIYLSGFQSKFKKSDIVTNYNQLKLTDSFYLPASISKIKIREYKEFTKIYTSEEAKTIATEKLNVFIKKLEEKGIQIIENNVTIEVDEKNCTANGNIIVNEQIGKISYIDESSLEEIPTETTSQQ